VWTTSSSTSAAVRSGFVRQNAFWFAVFVPVLVASVLPITGPAQVLLVLLIYLGEAIAYAIHRSRESS
jgi:hypothetical protein